MVSSFQFILLSSLLIFSLSQAQPSFRPPALLLPVKKDASTHQYVTKINQRTPLVSLNLVVDLGGRFLLVNCDKKYVSSRYHPVHCRTPQCSLSESISCGDCFNGPKPGCNNNTCGTFPENPVISTTTVGELAEDVISVQSTDGSHPGRLVTVPRFLFSCAPTSLLKGLASGVTGMAGLGRTRIALPSQFASAFNLNRKFAMCLSSSTSSDGVIIFGGGPYKFLQNTVLSDKTLTYAPLLMNPVHKTSKQGEPLEYFIGVKSIKINSKIVPLNTTLLFRNGGTKISTTKPYTVLETSIYKAVTTTFIKECAARSIKRVSSVAPFGVCFSTKNVGSTRVGPSVPYIDLVLQNENVVWPITGSNSMVYVSDNVLCLGVVDGGLNPTNSIVIGGYQLEDTLLQFDLSTSRLGFSGTLLGRQTTCANFNFTSSP